MLNNVSPAMADLQTSLLREKFVIRDKSPHAPDDKKELIALSNRMAIDLTMPETGHTETFVIRAQNMHSCVRMCARIMKAFLVGGPIMHRAKPLNWKSIWDVVVNDYEFRFNEQRWCVIYHNGKIIFEDGQHDIFLDIIEKYATIGKDGYEKAVSMAEKAFQDAGKTVEIEHDSNVALYVNANQKFSNFGVILRGIEHTATFKFSVNIKEDGDKINIPQCLGGCAAFLEGVQLAFMVGYNYEKIRLGIIERFSKEEKQTKEATHRISRLNGEIANLERDYTIRYRPEKPLFSQILSETERIAEQQLAEAQAVEEAE